jgi:signal transduction histidine kinase
MAAPVTGSRKQFIARGLMPWRLPEVDQAPGASGGHFAFGQAELVAYWQRLRAAFLAVVMTAALALAADWGRHALRPLLVAALAAGMLADAVVRIRRQANNPVPVLLMDAASVGTGLALLQVETHAVIAPLMYAALAAAILLPWRRALAMWCYDSLIGCLVVLTATPLEKWLGLPPSGTRSAALVWVVSALFSALCLAEALLLTGANRRFAQAQQSHLAYEARRKDEFLAGVSHALRTPLTCVVGFGQLIEKDWADQLPAPVGVMLGELNQQADLMAAMVENLMVRAQDQAGGITLTPAPVNLQEIASGVIRSQAWLHPDKDIRLHGRAEITAWADPTATRQVLRNLVANAIQHGGDHVDVTISNGAWATVSVTDDAAGPVTCGGRLHIAPFTKINPTFAAPHLGLGLPTSLRLAELMGGDLTHRHIPGASTFTLTLPREPEEAGSPAA